MNRLISIDIENAEIKSELLDLKKQTQFSEKNFHNYFMSAMIQWEREKDEKERKKPNFVVYGMPEGRNVDNAPVTADQQSQSDLDAYFAKKIVASAGCDTNSISKVFRMGTGKRRDGSESKFPRLLKIQTDSEQIKKTVLRKQREIFQDIPVMTAYRHNFSQYIRADLTLAERLKHAELVKERNMKNEGISEGEPRWKIYNFALVPPAQGNFRRT